MPKASAHALRIPDTEGWTRTRRLRLLDFDVSVWSDDPTVVELVDELFAPTAGPGDAAHALFIGRLRGGPSSEFFAALDGEVIVRSPARSVAFAHAMFEANQQAIEQSTGHLRVHVAAVVVRGRGVMLPGPMGARKSTLAAGLVARGAAYLTDEVGALDLEHGHLHPYAKPISVGRPPASLRVRWEPSAAARAYLGASGLVPVTALGGTVAAAQPLAVVVLPTYEPTAATWVEPLSRTDALAAVAAHTFHLDAPGSLAALARLMDGVDCYRLVSGSLPEAVAVVEDLASEVVAAR